MPFYNTIEFWTAAATVVALFMPLTVLWLSNRTKKSKLVVIGSSVINQDPASEEADKVRPRLMNVGRVIIRNDGKYKASLVEAYIEKIIFDNEERVDFFPMPLFWTHGQLNKKYGPTVRDVYPNQTVYLDIFNHIYDDGYVGESIVSFAVAAGTQIENLSRMNLGESEILVRLYQESGQVDEIRLKLKWDGKNAPTINILS